MDDCYYGIMSDSGLYLLSRRGSSTVVYTRIYGTILEINFKRSIDRYNNIHE